MGSGAWMMFGALLVALATLVFLVGSMIRNIRIERSGRQPIWREFSLGLSLVVLFFMTWIAHGIAEWQTFTDEQHAHGESAEIGDFVAAFSQSTLENWQSEFLQLFSFVVLAALYTHRGSAESKDSDERVEASLQRIERKLGTLPPDELHEQFEWPAGLKT